PSSKAVERHWNFDLPLVSLCVNRNGDCLAVALGDGSLRLLAAHGEAEQPQELKVHSGVSLSLTADADAHAFFSGGDDGKAFIIDPQLMAPTLLAEHKGKWIDHVAASSDGEFRAYTVGKEVRLVDREGKETMLAHPSSVGGLAFSPNGKRLAASHYGGVHLWWCRAKENVPVKLLWKGSHLGVQWSPDGKILMSSLQENALHGWRLADNNEMRMEGYAAKIHSMGFTSKGRYLATSGAGEVVCWPFFGGGPWGKNPLTLGGRDARTVTRVAPHPKDEMVAAGYDDGMIILAPMDGRMEMMIQPPTALHGAAVTGLCWNPSGNCLFAGLENGYLLLFTIESVSRAVKTGSVGNLR
ncbi:MAG: WD40 repeat domain-containing protein, partial [Pseudomonadota bacterium]|nr:WD40 repeat domain-containing protein [Pseudomonadota bacterium]